MTSDTSSEDHKAELDRQLAWVEPKLSPRAAKFIGWPRKPSSRLARFPVAILLIAGGIFSILPVLGLWMLPLGLLLFVQDVPILQRPMARMLGWVERKWIERQRAKGANDSLARLFDSIFRSAAAHGVTQKPTSLINQGLRHN